MPAGVLSDPHHLSVAQVPFILPPGPITKPTKMGAGIVVPVSGAANTNITVTHGLGRIVRRVLCLANNKGASFTPQLAFGPGLGGGAVSTTQKVTIQGTVAMTSAEIWFL